MGDRSHRSMGEKSEGSGGYISLSSYLSLGTISNNPGVGFR